MTTHGTDIELLLYRYICSSIGKRFVRQKSQVSQICRVKVADLHMLWGTRKTIAKDGRWALQLWTLWGKQVLSSVCRSAATAVAGDNVDVWQLAMRVERCIVTMTASVSVSVHELHSSRSASGSCHCGHCHRDSTHCDQFIVSVVAETRCERVDTSRQDRAQNAGQENDEPDSISISGKCKTGKSDLEFDGLEDAGLKLTDRMRTFLTRSVVFGLIAVEQGLKSKWVIQTYARSYIIRNNDNTTHMYNVHVLLYCCVRS